MKFLSTLSFSVFIKCLQSPQNLDILLRHGCLRYPVRTIITLYIDFPWMDQNLNILSFIFPVKFLAEPRKFVMLL